MSKFNVFEQSIDDDVRASHELLKAQSDILFNISNLFSDAMNNSALTQLELSKNLDLSKGYVSRILSGTENMSLKNLAKIAYKLGFTVDISLKKIEENNNVCWANFSNGIESININHSFVKEQDSWTLPEAL